MKTKGSPNPFESGVSVSASTSSIISKASTTASMLSNWISRSLKKKKKSLELTEKARPRSKIPILQIKPRSRERTSFLSKFKYKKNRKVKTVHSDEKTTVKAESLGNEVKHAKSCSTIESQLNSEHFDKYPEIIETFKFISNNLESKSRIGLRESIEIYNQIEESKSNLIEIVSKYVQDESLAKNLFEVLSNHTKMQADSESRAQKLAHEMWLRQNDVMKEQELQLKEDLSTTIKQNRDLQAEIELLMQKNEQLALDKTLMSTKDFDNQLMETLKTNNEKLRRKLSSMSNQVKKQEREFQLRQQENQSLESQLCISNSQLCNYKNNLQKLQYENEIDRIQLTHQLQLKQSFITKISEAGKDLLQTLGELDSINLTNFENSEGSLPDLIAKCASTIAGLSNEITLKDNEIKALREENLQKFKHEQEAFGLKDSKSTNGINLQMDQLTKKHEILKEALENSNERSEELQKKLIEKEEDVILNKDKMLEYKSENDSLRMQLHGLKQIFNSSGSGDVARELVDSQEKLTCFQAQYYQLLSEKNYLVQQIQTANSERETMNQTQSGYYQFIQTQQQDLDKLNQKCVKLQKELDQKTAEFSTLQMENTKLKDEKSIMKQIYQQLKSEIKRVQKLQKELTGMSVETNRLAIIADYNKQLGEQYQSEVADRDEKISKLQSNVVQLSNAQLETSKDKSALCTELKEICNINKELNNSLVVEHQKVYDLDQSKKYLECSTITKLKAAEEMLKVERAALKELLQDYKTIVVQRDNLNVSQDELIQQINDLRANSLAQAKAIEKFNKRHLQDREVVANSRKLLKGFEDNVRKVANDLLDSQNSNAHLRQKLEEALQQTETLEIAKSYLQNTLQKLQNDLDNSRQSHIDLENKVCVDVEKVQDLEVSLKQSNDVVKSLSNANSELMQETLQLKKRYRTLSQDFEAQLQAVKFSQKEIQLKADEIENLEIALEKERRQFDQALTEKELECEELEQHCKQLKDELSQLESSTDDIELQSTLLSDSNSEQLKLKNSLVKIQEDHQKCTAIILQVKTDKSQLEEQLNHLIENTKLEFEKHKEDFENIIKEHIDQKKRMQEDLVQLTEKFKEIEDSYITECEEHNKLLEAHRDLAAKLLKAVRLLIDEKLSKQQCETNIENLSQQIVSLKNEKVAAENAIIALNNEYNDLKQGTDNCSYEESIQEFLIHLQEMSQQTDPIQELQQDDKLKLQNSYSNKSLMLKLEYQDQLDKKDKKIKQCKEEVDTKQHRILELEWEVSKMLQERTFADFQKSEVSMTLHEQTSKLQTETDINKHLTKIQENVLSKILDMTREGDISSEGAQLLLNIIQNDEDSTFL